MTARGKLHAHRLASSDARTYTAIVPQHGMFESRVLGLHLQVEQDRIRFYSGTAMLLESEELIGRLERMLEDVEQRRAEETRLREEAEREVARLSEELDRLRRDR
jgi:hypothetical protein